MKAEFTTIIEPSPEEGYWAFCPEIPWANGQGESVIDARENLMEAIILILKDRKENFNQEISCFD